jgi:hypothetical protein
MIKHQPTQCIRSHHRITPTHSLTPSHTYAHADSWHIKVCMSSKGAEVETLLADLGLPLPPPALEGGARLELMLRTRWSSLCFLSKMCRMPSRRFFMSGARHSAWAGVQTLTINTLMSCVVMSCHVIYHSAYMSFSQPASQRRFLHFM